MSWKFIYGLKHAHVEKSTKKSLFLESCKLRLGLNNEVHNKLITELPNLKIDCITARAFASIEKIISMTKKTEEKEAKASWLL